MVRSAYCLQLGIEEYGQILLLQQQINDARRRNEIGDSVIFLEHTPCITVGAGGGYEHILADEYVLARQGIKVYRSDRGGDVTYHGPGQLVCYPIIDLHDYRKDVIEHARKLEEIIIRSLKDYGIQAKRYRNHPGVWVEKRKIAAQGIAVQNWVTMHGIALNVCPKMEDFSLITPCGLVDYGVASMEQLTGKAFSIPEVRKTVRGHFNEVFELNLVDITREKILEMMQNANQEPA